jgi:hypothetical protein
MISKQQLDQELPIKISSLNEIINRIHTKYPLVSKIEVVLIVKSFFETIRYLFYINETISINNFVGRMKLNKFFRIKKNKILNCFNAQIATPGIYKKKE